MIYSQLSLNRTCIRKLLGETEKLFVPSLSTEVDLDKYSVKLGNFASFLLYKDGGSVQGYLAYYRNDTIRQLYIPLLCVKSAYQNKGIGSQLMSSLILKYGGNYRSVALEVVKTNTRAYQFYLKCGFLIVEDRGDKYLMEKVINQG